MRNHQTTSLLIACLCAAVIGCTSTHKRMAGSMKGAAENEYADEIMYLDSLRWLTGGPEYAKENTIDPDTLCMAWTGFAELYSKGEYEAAYDYLKEDQRYPNVLIYLRNSTAQYEFISSVWNVCVSAHAGSDEEYYKEIEDEYSLALLLTKTVVEMGGEDPYVPPHYMNLVMEFGQLILIMKTMREQRPSMRKYISQPGQCTETKGWPGSLALPFVARTCAG